jgi:hypothetical protein
MPKKKEPSLFLPRQITFKRTSNVFLNTGIVALHDYLDRFRDRLHGLEFKLSADELVVSGEELLEQLEWVYYEMGKELYDTATEKQIKEKGNFYFIESENRFEAFPKMNTIGLTALLTNNMQGNTKKESNTYKIENLRKTKPQLAKTIEEHFEKAGVPLLSKVYFNEPYTKITRLIPPTSSHFEEGKNFCDLTGEGYIQLENSISTSPFLSGLTNFNSFNNTADKKISWKAMYISRFAPKYCLYTYSFHGKGSESIFCYLFETNNLENLRYVIHRNKSLFLDRSQLLSVDFRENFKIFSFSQKKGAEEQSLGWEKYLLQDEIFFMLIFTVYRNLLQGREVGNDDSLDLEITAEIPYTMVSFRADSFANTKRPSAFEQFNHFKYAVSLMAYLEKKGGGYFFQNLLQSLLILKKSDRNAKDKFQRQRQLRNTILSKILHKKSVLEDLENLFFKCFMFLTSSDEQDRKEALWKKYDVLFQLADFYEPRIPHYKMNKEQLNNLQNRAIKLGYSIGRAVLDFDGNKPEDNAKQARAYMVHLHKSRTAEQFREAIIRFQKKYGIIVSNELLEADDMNDDQNFVFIKQFTIMAALNLLNGALKIKSANEKITN